MSTETVTTPIDATQVAQYHADGFVVVRGVFSPERIAQIDAEAQHLLGRTELKRDAEYVRTPTFFR